MEHTFMMLFFWSCTICGYAILSSNTEPEVGKSGLPFIQVSILEQNPGLGSDYRNSKIRVNQIDTGHLVYQNRFHRTKFYICPGVFLPVILSNYYDLPFNDILDWGKFAVVLKEKDVYDLKQILKDISNEQFVTLHNNLVMIQKHFQWNTPPIPYDAFHMVMYDMWLRHSVIKY